MSQAVIASPVEDERVESPVAAPPREEAISAEQMQVIAAAHQESRKVRRAASVAVFSGWSLAFFAAVSLITGLFSLRGFMLGVGLTVVAWIELRGAKGLRGFNLKSPLMLACNQTGLAVLIVIYAAWGMAEALLGPGRYDQYLETSGGAMAGTLQPLDDLHRAVATVFYLALIGGSIIAQGLTAVYYITRRGHIHRYLRQTPGWVVDTLRATSA